MARKKGYRGHYCKVCGEILPNEKFTGKGHAAHICKSCARKPLDEQQEAVALNHICRTFRYSNLSRQNRLILERYVHNKSERVRQAALDALSGFAGIFAMNETEDWNTGNEGWDVANDQLWDGTDEDIPF
jgi:methionyl-tRNA synthetase